MNPALAQEYPLHGLEGPPPPLRRLEREERILGRKSVQHPRDGRQSVLQRSIERENGAGHLGADAADIVAVLDPEVAPQQRDHGQKRGRSAVGDRAGLEREPSLTVVRPEELIEQPRLPHAGIADHRDELSPAPPGLLRRLAKLVHLRITADETGEAAGRCCLQARADARSAAELEDLDGFGHPLDRDRPECLHLDEALGELQHCERESDGAGRRELLHPRRQMRRLPHGGVVHAQVAGDGAKHDLSRVQSHTDLDLDAAASPHLVRDAPDGLLHAEGGVARAQSMVLVGERGAEERHDPVAHDLVDGSLVPVHRLHHQFEDRVENRARLFGITVSQQFHRALHIGKKDRDLLSLTLERRPRGQDLLGEALRRVCLGGLEPRLTCRQRSHQASALVTEPRSSGKLGATRRTNKGQACPAVETEIRARRVLPLALGTLHGGASMRQAVLELIGGPSLAPGSLAVNSSPRSPTVD